MGLNMSDHGGRIVKRHNISKKTDSSIKRKIVPIKYTVWNLFSGSPSLIYQQCCIDAQLNSFALFLLNVKKLNDLPICHFRYQTKIVRKNLFPLKSGCKNTTLFWTIADNSNIDWVVILLRIYNFSRLKRLEIQSLSWDLPAHLAMESRSRTRHIMERWWGWTGEYIRIGHSKLHI